MSSIRKKLLLLCGGKSAEHEISIISARNVYAAISKEHYDVQIVVIDRQGIWSPKDIADLFPKNDASLKSFENSAQSWFLARDNEGVFLFALNASEKIKIDIVFPLLHGPNGEDGTVQGLLKLLAVPFVGCDVLASAACMDKDMAKRILRDSGIPSAKFVAFQQAEYQNFTYDQVSSKLGKTLFIKPANMGSSVGVKKVKNAAEYEIAVADAFNYDHKVLIEEQIIGREIEVSILGNETLQASVPGEIRPRSKHDFYSYESKYLDSEGADLLIPAELSEQEQLEAENLALRAASALSCQGMVRVDLFLDQKGSFFVNELNTIPGFTSISMYPKLWEAKGLKYSQLIDSLLELAFARFVSSQQLKSVGL